MTDCTYVCFIWELTSRKSFEPCSSFGNWDCGDLFFILTRIFPFKEMMHLLLTSVLTLSVNHMTELNLLAMVLSCHRHGLKGARDIMSSNWFSKQNIEETLPNKDPKASSKRQELRTLLAFTCFSHQLYYFQKCWIFFQKTKIKIVWRKLKNIWKYFESALLSTKSN